MHIAAFHQPNAASPGPASCKVGRDRLVRLRVLAEVSPQICLRVLNLIAQQDLVPHAIDYARGERFLLMEVAVDDPGEARSETMLHRVAGLPHVRQARLYSGSRKIFPTCRGIFPHR
ncbi:hypothetical protein [Sphingomonas quercus]|uniref:ACT domain-containing protein n=1 Tax=Sphingomonas quercus TaxID=2842451 RepID=A0ABS6BMG1_9SPHN|nr:hypothetical protein [Sphingomonas quercus]MBU3079513.1 hypothetical protein [Sphingomonas quercus]